ncbi:GSCFA domain-containing protein [Flavobacterium difficile]|uniref:GSCFA domain-containing protein n=1 Tax=Flavobacterium difficile TaxID=2709659 RepID=A0ABX0I0V0_9FLAO|nr:GSCFA domain-containing protein [Flavobacterium difficile]NHM00818.1 GSCFA domain-containing protein [Flavobacterium difficile]
MNFQTQIPIQKSDFPIDYTSKVMLLGSCFAENMAQKFEYFKFDTVVNPFGIIFNPVSLEKLMVRSIHKTYFTETDIFYHNEAWHCYEVHSELSNPNKEEFLETLNQLIDATNQHIVTLTHCLITLGTSWVYRHVETNEIVANCHKVPQKQFVKELLSIAQIEASLQTIISEIQAVNPKAKFIFTVSPVRHIKDGFVENNVSKAHLISALNAPNFQLPTSNYFPSYEIMMDELRDYRFYTEDMLHPNQTAIDYIWIKFFENYVAEKEFSLMNQVCEIQRALKHRPFNPDSESHQKFLSKLEEKKQKITKENPAIHF